MTNDSARIRAAAVSLGRLLGGADRRRRRHRGRRHRCCSGTTRPQTDDATLRANFVGIAPQVSGHIVELHVRDNQHVREGDLLFVVDPRPYEIALARARASLALTRKDVDGLRNGVTTADAGIARAAAQLNASAADVVRRETGSGRRRCRDRPAGSAASRLRGGAAACQSRVPQRRGPPRARSSRCCPRSS